MTAMKLIIALGTIFCLFAGCVLPQYMSVGKDLEKARSEREQAEDKNRQLEIALREAEASQNQFAKDLMEAQAENTYLKKINQQISGNNRVLRQELNKKKSVIELQEKVIQLLDDTKKTIETSLKDQIAAQASRSG